MTAIKVIFELFTLDRANGRGGFGSQTAADLLWWPRRTPEKQTLGTVTASHKMLTLHALSSSLNAGTAKRGCLGRGEAFGCPPAVCPPNRPRPFAHSRFTIIFFQDWAGWGIFTVIPGNPRWTKGDSQHLEARPELQDWLRSELFTVKNYRTGPFAK